MKSCISTYSFHKLYGKDGFTHFSAIDKTKELGCEGVELVLDDTTPDGSTPLEFAKNLTEYAKEKGLHIVHVPAYSPYAVAEHTMALLLTSIRRIHKAYIRSRDFNFSLNNMTGFDLHGKTVGVIGTGRIGRVFIDICRGFGMKVLCCNSKNEENDVTTTLEKVLTQSDIVSLHCPLTEDTYHIIDEASLTVCKKGVVILNTSRGALVDADALLDGIKSRKVGAACLDVYEEENDNVFENREDDILKSSITARLLSFPNVIITSHQGFLTREALDAIARTTLDNAVSVEQHAPIEANLVGG